MIILGIETSCDETAISLVEANGDLENLDFKTLGSAVQSQIEIHKQYGGVFPTLAKREHLKNLPLILIETLRKANFDDELCNMNYGLWKKKNPKVKFPIDLIAVTIGPGLEPALWTGINFSEKLSQKWNIPVVGVNHMEGHIVSALIRQNSEIQDSGQTQIIFPAIALLISGGHTELIYLKNWEEKEKIGQTQDDAVGEAYDKVARMLGLPYPGGPEISRLAEEARMKNIQLEKRFPRPMMHSKDFNFSFSGLKTAVLYYLRNFQQKISVLKESDIFQTNKLAVAREFEDAVVETLISKTKMVIKKYSPKTLIIGGGVIANKALRKNFLNLKKNFSTMKIMIPEKSLTTDNATMIAAAGYIEYLTGKKSTTEKLRADGNLDIK